MAHLTTIVARLPLLGPVLGWTRTDGNRLVTRLWIKADDSDSQPALVALTARWDGRHVLKDSVRLWSVYRTQIEDPPAGERFALADIESGEQDDGIVRAVTLHRIDRFAEHLGPVAAGLTVQSADFSEPLAETLAPPRERPAAAAPQLPRPQQLPFSRVFPGSKLAPEAVAEKLFADLELALAAGRATPAHGEPRPRPKERNATMALCEAVLRPARDERKRELCFAAGCCRHPGVAFDRDLADRALGALAEHAEKAGGPELVLMLGDQIYADATGGVVDAEDRLEKYTSRYEQAYGSPGFRRLGRRVPLVMAGDDHEIRDNWPKDAIPPGAPAGVRKLLERSADWARLLFIEHQRSHGPDAPAWAPAGDGERLWYAFDVGPFPFFCFDTRFERTEDGARMMDAYQLERFASWLDHVLARKELRNVPKFVMSGSVMAPTEREFAGRPAHARRADSWAGYPDERLKVLELIVEKKAQNVVFISGDLHCAALASLHFSDAAELRCYAVVAPAFYAPFPFANLPAQEIAGREPIGPRIECRSKKKWDVNGFALLCVTPPAVPDSADWEIKVDYYADGWDANGRPEGRRERHGTLKNGQVL